MKQTIKVKVLTEGCTPIIAEDGDWIDLKAAEDVHIEAPYAISRTRKGGESSRKVVFTHLYVPLGVAMQLPDGMEAVIAPRSSSVKNFHFIQPNSPAVIDQPYCGDNDQWYGSVLCVGNVDIKKGDRICQFRIQLSQKATMKQKIKWLFSSGIEIEVVDSLGNTDRGGLGHSGVK